MVTCGSAISPSVSIHPCRSSKSELLRIQPFILIIKWQGWNRSCTSSIICRSCSADDIATGSLPLCEAKGKGTSLFAAQSRGGNCSQAKAVQWLGTPHAVPGFSHSRCIDSQGHCKDFLIILLLCLETWGWRLLGRVWSWACRSKWDLAYFWILTLLLKSWIIITKMERKAFEILVWPRYALPGKGKQPWVTVILFSTFVKRLTEHSGQALE